MLQPLSITDIGQKLKAGVSQQIDYLTLAQFSIERANDGIIWSTDDGGIIYTNEKLCAMLGYDRSELYSLTIEDIHPGFSDYKAQFEELKRLGGQAIMEAEYRSKSGRLVPVEISGNYFSLDKQEFNCCIIRDITERKKFESQLIANYAELKQKETRIRKLTKTYIKAQEEERQLVSVDLHDIVIQGLISVLNQVHDIENEDNNQDSTFALTRVQQYVEQLILETRHLMTALFPSTLSRYGLINLLEQELIELEEKKNFACSLESDLTHKLDHETETTLYRITHESLLNIQKHGENVRNVKVCFRETRNRVDVIITDDGVGFDVNQELKDASHRGIESMRRRAEMLNGSCTINSHKGKGTRIHVSLPIRGTK